MKIVKIVPKEIYIVLILRKNTKLHGVYTNREIADNVANKLKTKLKSGYVCVLKKRPRGPSL